VPCDADLDRLVVIGGQAHREKEADSVDEGAAEDHGRSRPDTIEGGPGQIDAAAGELVGDRVHDRGWVGEGEVDDGGPIGRHLSHLPGRGRRGLDRARVEGEQRVAGMAGGPREQDRRLGAGVGTQVGAAAVLGGDDRGRPQLDEGVAEQVGVRQECLGVADRVVAGAARLDAGESVTGGREVLGFVEQLVDRLDRQLMLRGRGAPLVGVHVRFVDSCLMPFKRVLGARG